MDTEPKPPEPAPPEPVLTDEVRKRIVLEEQLKAVSKAIRVRGFIFGLSVFCFLGTVGIAIYLRLEGLPFSGDNLLLFLLPAILFAYGGGLVWAIGLVRNLTRRKLQQRLEATKVTQKTEQLRIWSRLISNTSTNTTFKRSFRLTKVFHCARSPLLRPCWSY